MNTSKTKTLTDTYPKAQALSLVQLLVEESRWFQVEPLPYDVFAVTVKAEGKLPEPMGVNNQGIPVDFETWFETVERAYTEMSLEAKLEFRDYFVRGVSPAEAIEFDHAEAA